MCPAHTTEDSMALKITKAMSKFDLAEQIELDCGDFDIVCRQAALHNADFKAAVARRQLQRNKSKLSPEPGSQTGSFETDVQLYIESVFVSWGERPLKDDDGEVVPFSSENLLELFTKTGDAGRVLFGKIQLATADEAMFSISEATLGNSNGSLHS